MTKAPFIRYQTDEDLKREAQMVNHLAHIWSFTPEKQDDYAVIDFKCLRDGKLVAFLEIKSKFCRFADYDTYLCTCKDIDYGLGLAKKNNVPFLIAVKWNDFWGYVNITHNNYPSRKSGQMNRNDPNDALAMCYLIPMSEFKEIKV